MAVITAPDLGARQAWMRNVLLVAALAVAGEPGAELAIPGSRLDGPDEPTAAATVLVGWS
jgi:hypothetical protein